MAFRFYSIVLFLLFLVFALQQHNDQDAVLWIGIYLLAALFHLGAATNRSYLIPSTLAAIVSALAAIWCWPKEYHGVMDSMVADLPQIELARESMGLAIVSASLMVLSVKTYTDRKRISMA